MGDVFLVEQYCLSRMILKNSKQLNHQNQPLENSNSNLNSQQLYTTSGLVNSQLIDSRMERRLFLVPPIHSNQLGSILSSNIKYSDFIKTIQIGSLAEIKLLNFSNIWSVCQVTNLKFDESGILRFIEV